MIKLLLIFLFCYSLLKPKYHSYAKFSAFSGRNQRIFLNSNSVKKFQFSFRVFLSPHYAHS